MKLYPLLLCGLLAACSSQPPAEQASTPIPEETSQTPQEVTPKGEFAQIDVSRSQQAMDAITNGNGDTINDILQSPNEYAPPVLYLISAIMFDNNYQEQATFWYYAAQLRAGSDANKAGDNTAHGAISQLNQRFGQRIMPYAMSNPDRLQSIVNQVLEWDSKQQRSYDPRWIALHGKDVVTETRVNFAPREKWQEIDALTRSQFRKGLEQAVAQLRQTQTQ